MENEAATGAIGDGERWLQAVSLKADSASMPDVG